MNPLLSRRPAPPAHSRALRVAFAAISTILLSAGVASGSVAKSRVEVPASRASARPSASGGVPIVSAPLGPNLARLTATDPRRRVEVIIELARSAAVSRGRDLVRALGGQPGIDLHIIHGLSARIDAGAAARLAQSPLVHAISLNAPVQQSTLVNFSPSRLATVFDQSVGATKMWNRTTGAGVGVAVIDTGITGSLADFQTSPTNPTSRVVASAVLDPNASTAADAYGHGTDVAGLVAGNGGYRSYSDPQWGKYAGSAPDANLISIKISDDNGSATMLDAIYGLQFAVDHKSDYNIRVVNLSFRSTTAQSYQTDPLDAAVEQAWFHGIVVVAAAGNQGSAADAVSYAPANDPYVITVGAVDDQGTASTSDDAQASWSSRGVTQDGFAKPDLLAPGAHLVSTLAPGSSFAGLCPTCVTGNAYFQASGTSLAAPVVSGGIADLLAIHPGWTPSMVKGAITSTAQALAGGGGELDVMDAAWATGAQLVSDKGLTPNSLIDPGSGAIDYGRAGWTAGSWSVAASLLAASWSAASWSCASCSSLTGGTVSTTSGSWSTLGWTTMWG